MLKIKEITENEFDKEISEGLVLVDFWAPWCGPCKAFAPVLDEIQADFKDKIKIAKLNVDENPEVSSKFQVRSIPTLILFRDGKLISTKTGALAKKVVQEWIEKESSKD